MRLPPFCLLLLACCWLGCQPKVFTFTATPRIITAKDSVHLNWRTRGIATMSFYQDRIAHPPGDSADALEFVLVATKGGKESAPFRQQVTVVAEQSRDALSFSLTGRDGDTLLASGIKDTTLYAGFEIVAATGLSHRTIILSHNGVTAMLPDSGVTVTTLQGLPYDGPWSLKSPLTPEEKNKTAPIPNTLDALFTIKPIKH